MPQPPTHGLSKGPLVLIPLCRKGDRVSIEKQIQAGASVQEVDIEGNTPLHVAVEAPRNETATVQCLLEYGSCANAVNYIGAAPLHYVCLRKSNWRGVANILLENGAMIDLQTVAGKSALHFACENQLPELVEMLCAFAADPNLVDLEGNTPVHLTLGSKGGGRDTVKRQIMEHLVSYQGKTDVPNVEAYTPLHLACQSGYIRCAQYLLEMQADAQGLTNQGQSCLHVACKNGHSEVTQLLVQVCPAGVNHQDFQGNTPLHLCAMGGHLDCGLLLLRANGDATLRNKQGKTAPDFAKMKGNDLTSTHNPELMQALQDVNTGGSCTQS